MIQFYLCIYNQGYEVSLEKWKIYPVIADEKADQLEQLRVIDEEGESYLYSKDWFFPINVTNTIEKEYLEEIEFNTNPNKKIA